MSSACLCPVWLYQGFWRKRSIHHTHSAVELPLRSQKIIFRSTFGAGRPCLCLFTQTLPFAFPVFVCFSPAPTSVSCCPKRRFMAPARLTASAFHHRLAISVSPHQHFEQEIGRHGAHEISPMLYDCESSPTRTLQL